jgi:hypothetical protein
MCAPLTTYDVCSADYYGTGGHKMLKGLNRGYAFFETLSDTSTEVIVTKSGRKFT